MTYSLAFERIRRKLFRTNRHARPWGLGFMTTGGYQGRYVGKEILLEVMRRGIIHAPDLDGVIHDILPEPAVEEPEKPEEEIESPASQNWLGRAWASLRRK